MFSGSQAQLDWTTVELYVEELRDAGECLLMKSNYLWMWSLQWSVDQVSKREYNAIEKSY